MIQLNNVSKEIRGQKILSNITYKFEKGMIYGLYGPNGSGKTMILRMLAGLIHPTEGTVEMGQKILHKDVSFPPSVGIIIENMEMLQQLTAYENIEVFAGIKKIDTKNDIEIP